MLRRKSVLLTGSRLSLGLKNSLFHKPTIPILSTSQVSCVGGGCSVPCRTFSASSKWCYSAKQSSEEKDSNDASNDADDGGEVKVAPASKGKGKSKKTLKACVVEGSPDDTAATSTADSQVTAPGEVKVAPASKGKSKKTLKACVVEGSPDDTAATSTADSQVTAPKAAKAKKEKKSSAAAKESPKQPGIDEMGSAPEPNGEAIDFSFHMEQLLPHYKRLLSLGLHKSEHNFLVFLTPFVKVDLDEIGEPNDPQTLAQDELRGIDEVYRKGFSPTKKFPKHQVYHRSLAARVFQWSLLLKLTGKYRSKYPIEFINCILAQHLKLAQHKKFDEIAADYLPPVKSAVAVDYFANGAKDIDKLTFIRSVRTYVLLFKKSLNSCAKFEDNLRVMRVAGKLFQELHQDGISAQAVLEDAIFELEERKFLIQMFKKVLPEEAESMSQFFDVEDDSESLEAERKVLEEESKATEQILKEIPEIQPTVSSFDGLNYIKRSMRALKQNMKTKVELQKQLEYDCRESMLEMDEAMREALSKVSKLSGAACTTSILSKAIESMAKCIEVERQKPESPLNLIDQSSMDSFKLASIACTKFCETSSESYLPLLNLNTSIGHAVREEIFVVRSLRHSKDNFASEKYMKNTKQILNSSRQRSTLLRRYLEDKTNCPTWIPSWTRDTVNAVGEALSTIVLSSATVPLSVFDSDAPPQKANSSVFLFKTTTLYVSKTRQRVCVSLNPLLKRALEQQPVQSTNSAGFLPMVVEPKPWSGIKTGGYLLLESSLVRSRGRNFNDILRNESKRGNLDAIFRLLDILGSVAWRVNHNVLKVIVHAWNANMTIGDLKGTVFDGSKAEATKIHSIRCDMNYKLEIARSFVGRPIYFPHNLDFRGRCYPIPIYFNHLGSDIIRSLLVFDRKVPLGKEGMRWLLVHMSNVFGKDKLSYDGRVEFVLENKENIMDSANDPMGGKRWWMSGDKPWQVLACCFELRDAWTYPGGEEAFPSCIPVQMDGSCNGLQHYAALGRDIEGGKQVNLLPSEKPMDVYTAVANEVIKHVNKDLEFCKTVREADPSQFTPIEELISGKAPFAEPSGKKKNQQSEVSISNITVNELDSLLGKDGKTVRITAESDESDESGRSYLPAHPNEVPANIVINKINRKVVKQTIMTNVYGVTVFGAKAQVEDRFKELNNSLLSELRIEKANNAEVSENGGIASLKEEDSAYEFVASEEDEKVAVPDESPSPSSAIESMMVPPQHLRNCASYVATLIFKVLDSLFSTARKYQAWLSESCTEIGLSLPYEDIREKSKDFYVASQCEIIDKLLGRKAEESSLEELDSEKSDEKKKNFRGIKHALMLPRSFSSLWSLYNKWIDEGIMVEKPIESRVIREKGVIYPKQPMAWKTPLGLPVIQPYFEEKQDVKLASMVRYISYSKRRNDVGINLRKNVFGIPPNFIHSLDSTHMLLTVGQYYDEKYLEFVNNNYSGRPEFGCFASVHDSFWTHAAFTPQLNRICRESFYKLHSRPIMNELKENLENVVYKENFRVLELDLKSSAPTLVGDLNRLIERLTSKCKKEQEGEMGEIGSSIVIDDGLGTTTSLTELELALAKEWLQILLQIMSTKDCKQAIMFRSIRTPVLPSRGDLDLTKVLESPYFFN